MPIFYVYMTNNTDNRDDRVFKCVARSPEVAKRMAKRSDSRGRFSIGTVYLAKKFRQAHPDWYSLLSSTEPETGIG